MKNPKRRKALGTSNHLAVVLVVLGAFLLFGCANSYMRKHAVPSYSKTSGCPESKIRLIDAHYYAGGMGQNGFWAELDACGNQIPYYCLDQVPVKCWRCSGWSTEDCFEE